MAEQFGPNPWPQWPSREGQYLHYTSSTSTPTSPAALSSHPADAPTQPLSPTRTSRTWLALLTLYVLAPIVGEVLSGSTPPLNFITPFTFLLLTWLYGSGAIIARELVRRRGLGWTSILLLGAAYGILEEGLVVINRRVLRSSPLNRKESCRINSDSLPVSPGPRLVVPAPKVEAEASSNGSVKVSWLLCDSTHTIIINRRGSIHV